MKNKALFFLALGLCSLLPVQQKAQATSAGETWGIIGTALGGTALGLQALNGINNRGRRYSRGGHYYMPQRHYPLNTASYYPTHSYTPTYYAQPSYSNVYHNYYNRPTPMNCARNSYGFYGGY